MRVRVVVFIVAFVAVCAIAAFGYVRISTEERLGREYNEAAASADRQEWQAAVTSLEAIVNEQADYRDAGARLQVARTELRRADLYGAAMNHYRANDWSEAVAELQSLSSDVPHYRDVDARLVDAQRQLTFDTQYQHATARLAANDFSAAIAELQSVAASDYSGHAQAEADLARAHRAYADVLLGQARRAEERKAWPELEQLARQALAENPEIASAQRLLGLGLSRLGRYVEARQVLTAAVARDPKDGNALALLGWAHLNGAGGDQQAADRAFRQALQVDPTLANALAGLGDVQLDRSQRDEAEASFRKALSVDPTEAAALQGLGLLALDVEEYAEAETEFQAAIDQEPAEVQFQLDLARALVGQNKLVQARDALDRAKQLQPQDPDVDAALGRYFRQIKEPDAAIAAYDLAITRRPADAGYHFGRGAALLDLDRNEEALAEGDQAVSLGLTSNGHVLRAYALAQLGQLDDARAAARKALDADPTNPDAQRMLLQLAR